MTTTYNQSESVDFAVKGEYEFGFGKVKINQRVYSTQTAAEAIGKAREDGLIKLISAYRN
jgi:hypothetical protein